MNNRIIELIKAENLTAIKFAEKLDVQPSNISHIISGRNKPGYDFIVKVLERFPDINPDWLLLGKGDMYKKNHRKPLVNVNTNNYEAPDNTTDLSSIINMDFDNTDEFRSQISNEKNNTNFNGNPSAKSIVKIILFYSDNSFEVFNGRK